MSAIDDLIAIMAQLRDPVGGCPWDLQQTFASIVPHTLEEAYEVADAIERDDREDMRDELGDLLFQVIFYARLGEEEGSFDFDAIAATVRDKLIRRHPHVFGTAGPTTAEEQRVSWEAIKASERVARGSKADRPGALDDVPLALPALTRSRKLQGRAARVGFEWPDARQVIDKVREELDELDEALAGEPRDAAHVAEEVGDLLLACVNLARQAGVDAEQALRAGNRKFEKRFKGLESVLAESGEVPEDASFERLEAAYQTAKAREGEEPMGRP